jgi:hypothetical protein
MVAIMSRTESATEAQYTADYIRIVGVDPVSDVQSCLPEPILGRKLLQKLSADHTRVRDEHLLSTILQCHRKGWPAALRYAASTTTAVP